MMYSARSEHGQRRQYGNKGTRQWDDHSDRWEEKHEPHRDVQRNSYHKHSGDELSSTDWKSRGRKYSDSPQRLYSEESMNRERNRKSPMRRRMSSPDWCVSEKKRRFTQDTKDDHRYRRQPDEKIYRQSPDRHAPRDLKRTLTHEEDFKYRKTTKDSRNRHEDVDYRHLHDDSKYRRSTRYDKDRQGQGGRWGHAHDRTLSKDCATKSYAKPRGRNDGPSAAQKVHRHNRTTLPLDGSLGQSFEHDVTNQRPAVPDEKKSTKGFRRFLDVLNKGVNVDMLTKIVTQAPTGVNIQTPVNHSWSPSYAGGQQEGPLNINKWSTNEQCSRLGSPQQRRRSVSPKGSFLSDEKSVQQFDGGPGCFNSNNRSRSPSVVEEIPLTPEDENKRRQMQDVLQAIGMDFGFEELGQMSHRIQERLYGKKDSDFSSKERVTRTAFSPRRQSRSSSSSRSSFNPSTQDYSLKKDSYNSQSDATATRQLQVHRAVEYGHKSSSSSLQDSQNCEDQKSTAMFQTFSPNASHTTSESSKTPAAPTYSPVNYSPLLYPALPPNLPHAGPGLVLPRLPPFLPYPSVSPLNIIPAIHAQTRPILPQHTSSHQPMCFLLPNLNPLQPLYNTQKSKTLSRPRCLQVIETKQPG